MSKQKITRVPPYWPGDWVRLKQIGLREPGADLSGKIRQVRSLTASITAPDQPAAIWRVHFADGRSVPVGLVERGATEAEITAMVVGRNSRE